MMVILKAFWSFIIVVNIAPAFCAFNDWYPSWARNQQPDYARIMPTSSAQWDSIQTLIRNGMQSTLSLDKLDPLSGVREGVVTDHGTYTARSVGIPIVAGHLATAAFYLPKTGGPKFPAVIHFSGPWLGGKHSTQDMTGACRTLANDGYIVLMFDMGYSVEFTGVPPHDSHYGQICEPFGFGVAQMQIVSCMRGIDYLFSRNDVDTSKIGATGSSTGGSVTLYFGAIDNRVKVSVPVCPTAVDTTFIITTFRPVCHIPPFVGYYGEHLQFFNITAPRALYMINEGPLFPAVWNRSIFPVWDLYGNRAADCIYATEGNHNYNMNKSIMAAKFFNMHFKGAEGNPLGYAHEDPAQPVLAYTSSSGWLTNPYENNAAWLQYNLGKMWLDSINPPVAQQDLDNRVGNVRQHIMSDAFRGLSKIDVPLNPSGSTIQVDPSFSLTLSTTNGNGARKPTFIMISPEGDTGLSVLRGILAGKGYAVVAATFRGTGNNRVKDNRPTPSLLTPDLISDFWVRIFGVPTLGLMYYDVKRVLDYLHTVPWCDTTKIGVVGEDIGGITALITAMMDDRIDMVGTKKQLFSWMHEPTSHRLFVHPVYSKPDDASWHEASWPYGVGKYADITMMAGLAYPCAAYVNGGDDWYNIYVTGDGNNARTPLNQTDLSNAYKWSADAFMNLGKPQNIQIKAGSTDQEMADWFEARINAGDIINRTMRPGSNVQIPGEKEEMALSVSPNPFNPATTIIITNCKLRITNPELKIFNIRGKLVADLSSQIRNSKFEISNSVNWDASHCSSGTYIVRLKAGGRETVSKAILMR